MKDLLAQSDWVIEEFVGHVYIISEWENFVFFNTHEEVTGYFPIRSMFHK